MTDEIKKEENVVTEVEETMETEVMQDQEAKETKPEKEKVSFGTKVKGFGKKAWTGVKKVAPYAGAFIAGAGAAVGTLLVLTRPDGTEVQACIDKDDDLVPVDDFVDGEAEIVEDAE